MRKPEIRRMTGKPVKYGGRVIGKVRKRDGVVEFITYRESNQKVQTVPSSPDSACSFGISEYAMRNMIEPNVKQVKILYDTSDHDWSERNRDEKLYVSEAWQWLSFQSITDKLRSDVERQVFLPTKHMAVK